jgi:predicted MFS family arabinose efflux permease
MNPATILVCACIILFLSFGARAGFGLYLQPVSLEFGWGREVLSFSLALQQIVWGALGPIAGIIADRYGTGRVVAGCGALYTLGLAGMAFAQTPLAMHFAAGLLVGAALSGATFATVLAVVGRTVAPERRSTALGVATAAGSFGQFALLPVNQLLISALDWHTALLIMAAMTALIMPLAAAVAGRPGSSATGQPLGAALREAMRERGFHLLFWGYFVCGFHIAMLTVHLPSFVTDAGMSVTHGMTALALIGLFNIVGTLGAGWAGGRFSKKYLLSSIYSIRAALIALLVFFPLSPLTLYIFACGIGVLWLSTVPLTNGLVGQIFGLRYMATLTGIAFLSHQVGSFLGAWGGGLLYDALGSYDLAWQLGVAIGLIAGVAQLFMDDRPTPRMAQAAAAA